MRAMIPALMMLGLLAGCAPEAEKAEKAAEAPRALAVENAWVRLAAVPGRPGAAYFTVKGGPAAERLTKVEADKVATVELHASMKKDGAMTMAPLAGVDVPAGGEAAFAPGGNHAMMFGVDPSVAAGGTLPLRLSFASGAVIEAQAKVVAAGADAPGEHSAH